MALKKFLAFLLCFSLLDPTISGLNLGSSSWAWADNERPYSLTPQQALEVLERARFFSADSNGRLRDYVVDPKTGRLTQFGETVSRLYQAAERHDEAAAQRHSDEVDKNPELKGLSAKELLAQQKPLLEALAKSGPNDPAKQRAAILALQEMRRSFGSVLRTSQDSLKSNGEIDMLASYGKLMAIFDAATNAKSKTNPKDMRVVDGGDHLSVYDKQGNLLYVMNKQEGLLFRPEIYKFQEQAQAAVNNAAELGLGECVGKVYKTGRYNHSLFKYGECVLDAEIKGLREERGTHAIQAMSMLLGENPAPAQMENSGARERLEKKLADKPILTGAFIPSWAGSVAQKIHHFKTAGEYVYPELKKRDEYLQKAEEHLKLLRERVEKLRGKDVISNKEVEAINAQENLAKRYLTLAKLESLNFKVDLYLEALGYSVERDQDGKPLRRVPVPYTAQTRQLRDAIDARPDAARLYKQMDAVADRLLRAMQGSYQTERRMEAESDTSDLKSVNAMLNALNQELNSINQTQNALNTLLPMRDKLLQDGRVWSDVGGWSLLKAFFDEASFTPMVTEAGAHVLKMAPGFLGGGWAKDYLSARETLKERRPQVEAAINLMAKGKGEEAALDVAYMDPSAHKTNVVKPIESGGERLTMHDRIEAVMRKTREALELAGNVHLWAGILVDSAKWSAFSALGGAPFLARVFKGGAELAAFDAGSGSAVRLGLGRNFAREIAENVSNRFAALTPKVAYRGFWEEQLKHAIWVRGWRTFSNLVYTSGLFGLIGAGWGAGTALFQGRDSPFYREGNPWWKTAWKAASFSAPMQARWFTQSWHPAMLFFNIPFTAFQNTILYEWMQYIANRGVVTGILGLGGKNTGEAIGRFLAGATGKAGTTMWGEGLAFEQALSVSRWGWMNRLGSPLATKSVEFVVNNVVMMDHLMKFTLFGSAMNYLGQNFGYWYRSAAASPGYEPREDTRIKHAIADGMMLEEAPLWMLLPQSPYQQTQFQEYRVGERMVEELLKKNGGTPQELVDFVNRAPLEANGSSPFRVPERFRARVMRQGLGERIREGPLDPAMVDKGVVPTTEQQLRVLRKILPEEIQKEYGVKLEESPEVLLEILFKDEGSKIGEGGILLSENARQVVREMLYNILETHPEQVGRIYAEHKAKTGQISDQGVLQLAQIVRYLSERGSRKFKDTSAQTGEYLKRYDEKWKNIIDQGMKVADTVYRMGGLEEKDLMEVDRLKKMLDAFEARQADAEPGHYTEALDQFREYIRESEATGALKKPAVDALREIVQYFDVHEAAYHADNSASLVYSRVQEALERLKLVEKQAGPESRQQLQEAGQKILSRLREHYREMGIHERDGKWEDKRVASGRYDDPYENDLKDDHPAYKKASFMQDVEDILDQAKKPLSQENKRALDQVYQDIRRAPWLLTNFQGHPLKGWRPGQFLSDMRYSLELMASYGPDAVPKIFTQEPTGGGKTNIIVRFVAPIQMAVAKRGQREFHVVTPKQILVEQIKRELDAMLLTGKISVKTWGDLVGDQAQRKLQRGTATDNIAVAVDEGDVPTLQPQTTVGAQAGTVSAESLARRLVDDTRRMKEENAGGYYSDLKRELSGLLPRMRTHREALEAGLSERPSAIRRRANGKPDRRHGKDSRVTLESLEREMNLSAGTLYHIQMEGGLDMSNPSKVLGRARNVLRERSSSVKRTEYASIEEPLKRLKEKFAELDKAGGKKVELPREDMIDLKALTREVEMRFYEAKIRGLVRQQAELVDSVGAKDPRQVRQAEAIKDLGRQMLSALDQFGGSGVRARKPVGAWERMLYVFGFDLAKRDMKSRLVAQEKTLSLAHMNAGPTILGFKRLADKAEALGEKQAAERLRQEAQALSWDKLWGEKGATLEQKISDLRGQEELARKLGEEHLKRDIGQEDFDALSPQARRAAIDNTPGGRLAARLSKMADEPELDASPKKIAQARELLEDVRRGMQARGHDAWASEAGQLSQDMNARELLERNAKDIRAEWSNKKEGWDYRLLVLLAEREKLMDVAVSKRSPVYEVIGQMVAAAALAEADRMGYLSRTDPEKARQLYQEAVESARVEAQADPVLDGLRSARERYLEEMDAEAGAIQRILEQIEPTRSGIGLTRQLGEAMLRPVEFERISRPVHEAYERYFDVVDRAVSVEMKMDRADPQTLKDLQAEHSRLRREAARLNDRLDVLNRKLAKENLKNMEPRAQGPVEQEAARALNDAALFGGEGEPARYQELRQAYTAYEQRFQRLNGELERELAKPEALRRQDAIENLRQRIKPVAEDFQSIAQAMDATGGRLLSEILTWRQGQTLRAWTEHKAVYEQAQAELTRLSGKVDAAHFPQLDKALKESMQALQTDLKTAGDLKEKLARTPMAEQAGFGKKLRQLSADFAHKLTEAYKEDPFVDPELKLRSYFEINGVRGALTRAKNRFLKKLGMAKNNPPSAYVEGELSAAYQYFHNNVNEFRFDHKRGRVETVFVGENSPDLQEPSKYVEEWLHGVDVNRRLRSLVLLGPREMLFDKNMPVYGASGTISGIAKSDMIKQANYRFTGRGSEALKNPELEVFTGRSSMIKTVLDAALGSDHKTLHVISVPDRAAMREWQKALSSRVGPEKAREISASIFSDVTQLMQANPESKAHIQDKMGGEQRIRFTEGRIQIVFIASQFGRGLDLPLKKYNRFVTYYDSPYKTSASQRDQIRGRTAPGRIPPGSKREDIFLLDVQSAQNDPLFRNMVLYDPMFRDLRERFFYDAQGPVLERMRQEGRVVPNWSDIHAMVLFFHAGDPRITFYKEACRRGIDKGMYNEEVRQLRGSGFLSEPKQGGADSGQEMDSSRALPWAPLPPGVLVNQ